MSSRRIPNYLPAKPKKDTLNQQSQLFYTDDWTAEMDYKFIAYLDKESGSSKSIEDIMLSVAKALNKETGKSLQVEYCSMFNQLQTRYCTFRWIISHPTVQWDEATNKTTTCRCTWDDLRQVRQTLSIPFKFYLIC